MSRTYVVFARNDAVKAAGIDPKKKHSLRDLWVLPDGAYEVINASWPRTMKEVEQDPRYRELEKDCRYVKMYATVGN